ncbi:hypothetical protein E5083_01740 [Streptomyces bauhiniae]|uniref:(S)-ureidoglycine aminohydrolase cupin domain-containing protein n=1 Tax=Streptomyces bauhiniae TaxID=2340725 RepID=A0A4Z1DEE6_9ACTN|nr:cupin domain-containing protein [Streptomyces bauhiniae]TGN81273.1 hypothetical protein E5083_01740 [Streptomyces bauhiniae]
MNQDTDILADSPFPGDLDAELESAPARRRPPGAALFLIAGIVAVCGFIGGVYAEKGDDTASATRPGGGQMPGGRSQGGGSGFPGGGGLGSGGQGGGGQGGGGQARQGMSFGTVSKIKDGVVEVTTQDGKTVEIKTGDSVVLRPQGSGQGSAPASAPTGGAPE